MDAADTKRIILLGKTGAGKSRMANTMFEEEVFAVNHTPNSETSKCEAKTGSVKGRNITLIDTPGFFDTDIPEEDLKREIVRCITECSPGPHAFLIVLKTERFTEHEKAVITKAHEYFSEEVYKYATIVFTHGDQLPEEKKIENFVSENKFLSDLVKKCGGRCHVIDSKYWNQTPVDEYRSNRFQVEELLKTIDKTVKGNKRGCYTNEMLQAVEEEIKREEEIIRQSSGIMSNEEIRQQAKAKVSTSLMIKLAGVTTGTLLGAIFGVAIAMAAVVSKIVQNSAQSATIQRAINATVGIEVGAAAVVVVAASAGAVTGALIGSAAANSAETPSEASTKAAHEVTEKALNIIKKTNEICNTLSQLMSKEDEEK